jgi:hypothetical protein
MLYQWRDGRSRRSKPAKDEPPMNTATDVYRVVVPPQLTSRWEALPEREHGLLIGRMERAAQSAHRTAVRWPNGPAGAHRGRHRAIVGDLWLLYRLDDEQRTLSLLEFGRVQRDGREPL